jgi:hypothetical protein
MPWHPSGRISHLLQWRKSPMPARRRISVALLFVITFSTAAARAQTEPQLQATKRLFAEVPGIRNIKHLADGRYFVLTSNSVFIFDAKYTKLSQIPAPIAKPTAEQKKAPPPIAYAEDFDVDSAGRVYIADRGANAIRIFSPDGALEKSIPVESPTGVVALSGGEIAVATTMQNALVTIFDSNGKVTHQFGEYADITDDHPALNKFLNSGRLASDGKDAIYYAFIFFPEPTVRRYDRAGYASLDASLTGLEFQPEAQFTRRQISKQKDDDATPNVNPSISGFGVDAASGEIWLAMGDLLVVLDKDGDPKKDGDRKIEYRSYTTSGARLEPRTIVIEPDRLILISDVVGAYEFARPDKAQTPAKAGELH